MFTRPDYKHSEPAPPAYVFSLLMNAHSMLLNFSYNSNLQRLPLPQV